MNKVTEAQRQGLGLYVDWGFTLEHDGAMAVLLLHEGKLVARFSQAGASKERIQAECARHLVMKHGWDGCIWS
ncbi:unnamed protein product [marine sediment metagenome]|uniref:Uncharacterized protein n=1 Tax=marine sediment metagenome TaxID=412755 RepID=X1TMJ8_9ZZZZ